MTSPYWLRNGTLHPEVCRRSANAVTLAAVLGAVALAAFGFASICWLPLLALLMSAQLWWTARRSQGHEPRSVSFAMPA